MTRLCVTFAVVLLGCASTDIMRFIGKDARRVQIQNGPPLNVYDLPDGTRAFQYSWAMGTPRVPEATAQDLETLVGDSSYYSPEKLEAGSQIVKNPGCLVTCITKWDASAKAWIVIDLFYRHEGAC
jgi:hypothetical protein